MKIHKRRFIKLHVLLIATIGIALLMTSCISVDVNSNLKFCRNVADLGDWYAKMEVIASAYDVSRSGGVIDADNEINELVSDWNEMGGQWSWRRTTSEDSYIWYLIPLQIE